MKQLLRYKYGIGILILIGIRAFLNALIPLMDKTEARYAEIGRIMQETGNWVTPQIDYNVAFWAKPPLSTWLSSLSFELFGVHEFTARLPYLLCAIGMILLIGKYGKRNGYSYFLPGLILFTIPEFFIHAGVVSTDMALAFCVTLVMLSFWEAMSNLGQWYWKYLLFVGLGLGLLAKGPIIFILCLPPMFVWTVYTRQFKKLLKTIPWFSGTAIVMIVAFPWYYLAEKNSPGFFDYFIVGEHFKRFFDSNWQGDKYGFPKVQPLGIIWGFLLVFALPWILLSISKLWKNRSEVFQQNWIVFLLCWLLWTPLFFSVSKSLIHPYIMPVLVPIALIVCHYWKTVKNKKTWFTVAFAIPFIGLILGLFSFSTSHLSYYSKTDKWLIQKNTEIDHFYHFGKKSYSSQFYSSGTVESINLDELKQLQPYKPTGLIVTRKQLKKLPEKSLENWKLLDSTHKKKLYRYLKPQ